MPRPDRAAVAAALTLHVRRLAPWLIACAVGLVWLVPRLSGVAPDQACFMEDSATVSWLEHETREITAEIPPGPHGERPLRVFVR